MEETGYFLMASGCIVFTARSEHRGCHECATCFTARLLRVLKVLEESAGIQDDCLGKTSKIPIQERSPCDENDHEESFAMLFASSDWLGNLFRIIIDP